MPNLKTKETLVESDQIEYGLERELRQANYTRAKRDKMQCLKDYLVEIGEDPRDYSQRQLQGMLDQGFMD